MLRERLRILLRVQLVVFLPPRMRPIAIRRIVLVAAALIAGCKSATDPGPGQATGLVIASGNNQQGVVGAALPAPIAVKVVDAKGRTVPSQAVEFTLLSGGGQLSSTSATTNSQGIASTVWTLGTSTSALQRVGAKYIDVLTGLPAGDVLFRATSIAGGVSRLVPVSGDYQTGFESQRLADSLVVVTTDAYGNVVPNVTVTFQVTSGSGSVSPATVTSNADGRAATMFTVGAFGSSQTVRASAGSGAYTFTATVRKTPDGTSITLGGRPYALAVSSHDVVYVGRLDAGVLTRFDGSSQAVTGTVSVGSVPTEVAFNTSGTKAYVTNQFSSNVGEVDVATNVQTRTIGVTGNPFQVVVSPDEKRIYVTTNANKVYAIDVATGGVIGQLATGATANGLAVSADGATLYVSTRDGGSVLEVSTASMTTLRTFTPGGTTQAVVIARDGSELYVVNEQGFLYAYNLATAALVATVDLGGPGPFGMALTPDGTKLYVTVRLTGAVQVVSRATHSIVRSYFVDGHPRRIGFTSDGTAVVANEDGYVTWLR